MLFDLSFPFATSQGCLEEEWRQNVRLLRGWRATKPALAKRWSVRTPTLVLTAPMPERCQDTATRIVIPPLSKGTTGQGRLLHGDLEESREERHRGYSRQELSEIWGKNQIPPQPLCTARALPRCGGRGSAPAGGEAAMGAPGPRRPSMCHEPCKPD